MKLKKIALIDCEKLSREGVKTLRSFSTNEPVFLEKKPSSIEALNYEIKGCDALITSLGVDITKEVVEKNPQLK